VARALAAAVARLSAAGVRCDTRGVMALRDDEMRTATLDLAGRADVADAARQAAERISGLAPDSLAYDWRQDDGACVGEIAVAVAPQALLERRIDVAAQAGIDLTAVDAESAAALRALRYAAQFEHDAHGPYAAFWFGDSGVYGWRVDGPVAASVLAMSGNERSGLPDALRRCARARALRAGGRRRALHGPLRHVGRRHRRCARRSGGAVRLHRMGRAAQRARRLRGRAGICARDRAGVARGVGMMAGMGAGPAIASRAALGGFNLLPYRERLAQALRRRRATHLGAAIVLGVLAAGLWTGAATVWRWKLDAERARLDAQLRQWQPQLDAARAASAAADAAQRDARAAELAAPSRRVVALIAILAHAPDDSVRLDALRTTSSGAVLDARAPTYAAAARWLAGSRPGSPAGNSTSAR
jgi:Tfp pilus assembly protein PilN